MGNLIEAKCKLFTKPTLNDHLNYMSFKNIHFTEQSIKQSLRLILDGQFTHEGQIRRIRKCLHSINSYLTNSLEKYDSVESLLSNNRQKLLNSAIQVLRIQYRYLNKKTNPSITFFHFMKQADIYLNYIIMRYVVLMGNIQKTQKLTIYHALKNNEQVNMFHIMVNWLYYLVSYRSSPIFIQNHIVDHLIYFNYLFLCGIIAHNSSTLLSTLTLEQKDLIINFFFYISIYILSKQKITEGHLIDLTCNTLNILIKTIDNVSINIFTPSYWFYDQIGVMQQPFLHEVLILLCLNFARQSLEISSQKNQQFSATSIMLMNLALNLHIKFSSSYPQLIQISIIKTLPYIKGKNIQRAFIIQILARINPNKRESRLYFRSNLHKGYEIGEQILILQNVVRAWRICENKLFFNFYYHAIQAKTYRVSEQSIWSALIQLNKLEIFRPETKEITTFRHYGSRQNLDSFRTQEDLAQQSEDI